MIITDYKTNMNVINKLLITLNFPCPIPVLPIRYDKIQDLYH